MIKGFKSITLTRSAYISVCVYFAFIGTWGLQSIVSPILSFITGNTTYEIQILLGMLLIINSLIGATICGFKTQPSELVRSIQVYGLGSIVLSFIFILILNFQTENEKIDQIIFHFFEFIYISILILRRTKFRIQPTETTQR